jgi:hypothetical protein
VHKKISKLIITVIFFVLGVSFERNFAPEHRPMSASVVMSPSQNRLSPRPTLASAVKSPQFVRQQAMTSDDQVRASPGETARQQQSPAPMRSRVVESGFHSTSERSRPPSPSPNRNQDPATDCRTPVQQNRIAGGAYTPSSAPTLARQALPPRQMLQQSAVAKPMQAGGLQQLSNTALVAQRFGAGAAAMVRKKKCFIISPYPMPLSTYSMPLSNNYF